MGIITFGDFHRVRYHLYAGIDQHALFLYADHVLLFCTDLFDYQIGEKGTERT